jgi:hypothetical protein
MVNVPRAFHRSTLRKEWIESSAFEGDKDKCGKQLA